LVGLELELKRQLGLDVDLVTYNGINPHIKKKVLKEEIKII
jgi:predicted nucleotidyltransferase